MTEKFIIIIIIIIIINPLTTRVLGHHRWFCNHFFFQFFPVLHCPLGLAKLQAVTFCQNWERECGQVTARLGSSGWQGRLHWLPLKEPMDHKTLSLAYNCFSSTAPQYLPELISCHEPPWSLQSSKSCFYIPSVDENHTKKEFVFRVFSNSAPRL